MGEINVPIRDYQCKQCNNKFEQLYLSFSKEEVEAKNVKCPKCGSVEIERLISAKTSFQLKGSGYYSTDYKKRR